MRKIRAIAYLIMAILMCSKTMEKGQYLMTGFVAFFSMCAIIFTLAPVGRSHIRWNTQGIFVKKFLKPEQELNWSELEELQTDHLGYTIVSCREKVRIPKKSMPDTLLRTIRQHLPHS